MLMKADRSCLVVVDIQERLLPAMAAPERVVANTAVLMKSAARLSIPMLVSEQYPRGLGHTVADLAALAPADGVVEKLHFSCAEEPAIMPRLEATGRRQAVVCGIEAHVCVLQTALGLAERGFEVAVIADACSSRDPANAELAFDRLRRNGVEVASTEMALFEWLNCAGTPEFKELTKLIK